MRPEVTSSDVSGVKVAVASVLGVLVLALASVWLVQGSDFFLYKAFAPKYEKVRRQTFEESKAYNQGMIQELQNMQFQYVQAKSQEEKDALASIILHRAADYPEEKMPADLRAFVHQLKQERLGQKY